jgi:hypothetical protein
MTSGKRKTKTKEKSKFPTTALAGLKKSELFFTHPDFFAVFLICRTFCDDIFITLDKFLPAYKEPKPAKSRISEEIR